MHSLILVLLLSALLLASGCMVPATHENNTTASPATGEPASISDDDRVFELLDQADLAIREQRLTTPVDDNAYLRYAQVLSIDPGNQAAERGMQQIVDTYLAWSIEAIESGRYRRATDMLNRARSVDSEHPSIDALETRIQKARRSTHEAYRLDPTELANRSKTLVGQLHELGRKAEKMQAKVTISARSDADGRWIYQQLNNASLNRIRATIKSGQPARISLIYP